MAIRIEALSVFDGSWTAPFVIHYTASILCRPFQEPNIDPCALAAPPPSRLQRSPEHSSARSGFALCALRTTGVSNKTRRTSVLKILQRVLRGGRAGASPSVHITLGSSGSCVSFTRRDQQPRLFFSLKRSADSVPKAENSGEITPPSDGSQCRAMGAPRALA
jgi:hypothetical protein